MAGIYFHIPFCRQACNYCNFHFTTSLRRKNELVAALLTEIQLRRDYLLHEMVDTIYFGGGTPSLLDEADCLLLTGAIQNNFHVSPSAEITFEANPDDVSANKLEAWKKAGINRLSIGIQSFFGEDLVWMNRAHNSEQSHECIKLAHEHGFHNLSIDLIYGTPMLTDETWKKNVDTAIAYQLPHLSCYALTVEPKTPLMKMISMSESAGIDPDRQAHQFLLLMEWMKQAGYEHYEISNFAKPGWRSRHNSSYWQGIKYLGLGPAAHSFDGKSRQWNVANNNIYIDSLRKRELPYEREMLTGEQQLNEYLMTALRTMEGIDLETIGKKWGAGATHGVEEAAKKYINDGKMIAENASLRLTNEGKLLADGIAAELFVG